jgi:hypothetical protein
MDDGLGVFRGVMFAIIPSLLVWGAFVWMVTR